MAPIVLFIPFLKNDPNCPRPENPPPLPGKLQDTADKPPGLTGDGQTGITNVSCIGCGSAIKRRAPWKNAFPVRRGISQLRGNP